jgi:hypothetical protein
VQAGATAGIRPSHYVSAPRNGCAPRRLQPWLSRPLTLCWERTEARARRWSTSSPPVVRIGGLFNALLRELNETLYQFERPFVSDATKFQRELGPFDPTPHEEAVKPTVDWFRRFVAA